MSTIIIIFYRPAPFSDRGNCFYATVTTRYDFIQHTTYDIEIKLIIDWGKHGKAMAMSHADVADFYHT
jgi:hypothetical protein